MVIMEEYKRHPLLVEQDKETQRLFQEYVEKCKRERKPIDYPLNALLGFGS